MQTTRYIRKPLVVDAVQMTEENAQELRAWCHGELYIARNGKTTIEVRVLHPARPDQNTAQVGDWVLKSSQGYKIYADSAFRKGFELLDEGTQLELTNMGELLREKLAIVNAEETETGKPVMIPVAATDALAFKAPRSMDTL
jgi:hypothetical protein